MQEFVITDSSDVIIPPPDLRPIIETTSQYVAKKGSALEKQIAQRQASNQKFDFLKASNPYNAFYRKQIEEFRKAEGINPDDPLLNGGESNNDKPAAEKAGLDDQTVTTAPTEEISSISATSVPNTVAEIPNRQTNLPVGSTSVGATAASLKTQEKKPLLDRIKQIIAEKTEPKEALITEEKEFNYDVKPPPNIVALDVEIIKLTAQFVAANGRTFLATVSNREQKNPQFAFLKPTNSSLFLFFSDLVQAYQRVLAPPSEVLDELKSEANDENLILERLIGNVEYLKRKKKREENERKQLEDEKREMSLIDWHSFIILETIDFKDEDDEYLPPPSMTIEEINEHLEAEKRLSENVKKVGALVQEKAAREGESSEEDVQMDMEDEEEEEAVERIDRSDYAVNLDKVPMLETKGQKQERIQSFKADSSSQSTNVQKCTVCGQNIPVAEIEEHIRIELLDPKWREQRAVAQSKLRDSTQAEPLEMAQNLRNFVRVRKRPFDTERHTEEEELRPDQVSAASLKKWSEDAKVETSSVEATLTAGISAPPKLTQTQSVGSISASLPPNTMAYQSQSTEGAQKAPQIMRPSFATLVPSAQSLQSQPVQQSTPSQTAQQSQPPLQPTSQSQKSIPYLQSNINVPQFPPFNTMPGMPQMQNMPGMPSMPPMSSVQNMPTLQNMQPMQPTPVMQPAQPAQAMQPIQPMQNMSSSLSIMRPMQSQSSSAPIPGPTSGTVRPVLQRKPLTTSEMAGEIGKSHFIPEEEFLLTRSKKVTVTISVPKDTTKQEWNFNGQRITVPMMLTETFATLKTRLESKLNGMPPKKMKLKMDGEHFVKDNLTLAYYNVTPASRFEIGVRARGGRK